jgi:hypothetical protein
VLVRSCGALNIDGARISGPAWTRSTDTIEDIRGGRYGTASKDRIETGPREMPEGGRWPANVVLDASVCAELDHQSGVGGGGQRRVNEEETRHEDGVVHDGYRRKNRSSLLINTPGTVRTFGDAGGASRFFKVVGT